MSYKIKVKTIDGIFLVFSNVVEFETKDYVVYFTDSKTNLKKQFPAERVDVEEER